MQILYPGPHVKVDVNVGIDRGHAGNPDAVMHGGFQVVLHSQPHSSPLNGWMDAKMLVPTYGGRQRVVEAKKWHDGWDHANFATSPIDLDLNAIVRTGVKLLVGDYVIPVPVHIPTRA